MKTGKRKSSRYFYILVLFSFIIGLTPLFNNPYLYIFLWLLFLPYFILTLHAEFHKHTNFILLLFLYVFQILIYKLAGISTAVWGRYLGFFLSFVPLILMLSISQKLELKQKKLLFWIVVGLMLFNIADSIRLSFLYPFLNLDTVRYYRDFVSTINLGGSSFYNYTSFFADICYMVFLNTQRRKVKIMMLGAVIFTVIYLFFFTDKASTILYFSISILLITSAKYITNLRLFFFILFMSIGILVPILKIYQDEIIQLIISLSPSHRVSIRLIALVSSNELYESTSINAREAFWMVSLNTWLSSVPNFLFGIGDHFTTHDAAKTGVGQHSEIIDALARYGITGLLLLFYILKCSYIYVSSMFSKNIKLQVFTIFVIYILNGFTKLIFHIGVHAMIFLFLPIAVAYINKEENKLNITK